MHNFSELKNFGGGAYALNTPNWLGFPKNVFGRSMKSLLLAKNIHDNLCISTCLIPDKNIYVLAHLASLCHTFNSHHK